MLNSRNKILVLLLLQLFAVLLYPPAFFDRAPQAIVLPPALLILFLLGVITINTGLLNPLAGRSFLAFVQGVNIVVRLIMLFPNLRTRAGDWNLLFLVLNLIAMGLSWYTMTTLDKQPPSALRFFQPQTQ